jgi:hypothetical protein
MSRAIFNVLSVGPPMRPNCQIPPENQPKINHEGVAGKAALSCGAMLEDFRNEPFTDFGNAENRSALETALARLDRAAAPRSRRGGGRFR